MVDILKDKYILYKLKYSRSICSPYVDNKTRREERASGSLLCVGMPIPSYAPPRFDVSHVLITDTVTDAPVSAASGKI